ncbi:MAG: hypothetical protein OEW83_07365 [Acidimicrobiia bacterium]|nr:hypothetical protein [Acidimicrobiia bacterium]
MVRNDRPPRPHPGGHRRRGSGHAGRRRLCGAGPGRAPDGSWWILDGPKKRLAHFSASGSYLGAVAVPTEYLTNGQYFQYQLPRVLDDGALVASRLGGDSTTLLRLDGGDLSLVTIPANVGVRTDDGTTLYGFGVGDDGERDVLTAVDPETGEASTVDWFRTRAGTRYRVEINNGLLRIELPDSPDRRTLVFRLALAGKPQLPAHALVEVASGDDGTLFLYLIGGTDTGEGGQLAGLLTISPDGVASPVEPTPNPFTTADPGSPAHLGVRPGTSKPTLMIIGTDGVRVFAKS